ncbi:hypothetical protein LAV_00179 [Sphingobium phage Lacusarx]|uniref:Uncharacterized protein n=1 Tax=Sphingobium phage Lacusarx TaxID=1980139 RepID=A0A1W6DXB4_9CAUD|nr:hypothetical protein FDH44_gp124 [Sphingobium phage Lacusarx]ARK07554.1 hypothetical protein LAV_00179 [Sphingobium phage Lacusarx]
MTTHKKPAFFDEAISRTFGEPRPSYFVYRPGAKAPTRAHNSRKWAISAAHRLAKKNPGIEFHVVKLKDSFKLEADDRIGLQVRIMNDVTHPYYGALGVIKAVGFLPSTGTLVDVEFSIGDEKVSEAVSPSLIDYVNKDAHGVVLRQYDLVEAYDLPGVDKGTVGAILWMSDDLAVVQFGNDKPIEAHPCRLLRR